MDIPEIEQKIILKFLEKFIFEVGGKYVDLLDLKLALKALPVRVDRHNCYKVDLFDFKSMQYAIIEF
jgi:hypothetical protein